MSNQDYVTLNNGYKFPMIGLGTGLAFEDQMKNALRVAIDYGYRSIDTAYLYTNEVAIGEELQNLIKSGKIKREDVFVTSKTTLKRLRLDYLDLYLIHHPFGIQNVDDEELYNFDENGNSRLDHNTDHKSLWKAMEKEVEAGRAKSIGISNFNSVQIDRLLKSMNYSKNIKPVLLEHPIVQEIGKKHGKSPGQVLLRFLTQRGIPVIPKSTTPERIRSNFDIQDFTISDEDMEKLFSLNKGEDGRTFHYKELFKGCEKHKEYPFHIPF
ncbi:Glycerol 2-dehydrogenase (NADP(+)) [Armadillidium nasatum]|uniref:Glycerol 2-dehydrogenase (NADP(+)) n=1 Tax=Armadillidium nasatum TaxID=96803 RepID=A0A5N5SML3_9CRUS|nr:Glycerol 2-dehydrogenase (NADP(+)) [Armadillidium nasatum]